MSPTVGPSSSPKPSLVFITDVQRIVTSKHNHGQMMLKIWGSAEHASWTTQGTSFPKNISILNFLVKYPPVLIFFFKEALFPIMYFVVFFLLTVKLHNLLDIFQFPLGFISWFNTGRPILSSSLWKCWTRTVLNGSLSVWDKGSYSV